MIRRRNAGHPSPGMPCAGALFCLAALLATQPLAADELTLDSLDATRSRPLFAPTRRPPPVASAPSAQPAPALAAPPAPPDIVLTGVVVGPDALLAVVRRNRDPKPLTLQVGRELDGWAVVAVEPRQILLQRDGQSVAIKFPIRAGRAPDADARTAHPAAEQHIDRAPGRPPAGGLIGGPAVPPQAPQDAPAPARRLGRAGH